MIENDWILHYTLNEMDFPPQSIKSIPSLEHPSIPQKEFSYKKAITTEV